MPSPRSLLSRHPRAVVGVVLALTLALTGCQPLTGPDAPAPKVAEAYTVAPASDPAKVLSDIDIESLADAMPEALSDAKSIWTVSVKGVVEFDHIAIDRQGRYLGVLQQMELEDAVHLMLTRVDLWTGHSMAPVEVPPLEFDPSAGEVAYARQRLSIVATAEGFTVLRAASDPAEDGERTSVMWSALYITRGGSQFTSETGSFEVMDGQAFAKSEPGRLFASTISRYDAMMVRPGNGGNRARLDVIMVDPTTGRTVTMPGDTGVTRASCADDDCTLKSWGEWSSGGDSARSYVEQRMITTEDKDPHACFVWPRAVGPSVAETCSSGVTGAGLDTSGDLAPDSAVARVAALAAIDLSREVAVVSWPLKSQEKTVGMVQGLVNLDDPTRLEATATCEKQAPAYLQMRRVAESPNGRFVVTNAVLFDRQTQRGVCFDTGTRGRSVLFTVDDDGTVRYLDPMFQQGSAIKVGRIENGAIDADTDIEWSEDPKEWSWLAPFALVAVPGRGNVYWGHAPLSSSETTFVAYDWPPTGQ